MAAVTVDSPSERGVRLVACRVLHALRVGGFLDTAAVADRAEVSHETAEGVLADAEQRGWVIRRTGRLVGWNLTASGRAEGERLLAAELDETGSRAVVEDLHGRFGPLNVELLDLCTDWQLRTVDGETRANDHTDPEHDAAVLERLERLHERTRPWLAELVAVLPRFGTYSERLAEALRHVRSGRTDWFTRPVIDSYHTVWFELHEDLLATLGLERTAVGEQPGAGASTHTEGSRR